jgi:hypothetical protein
MYSFIIESMSFFTYTMSCTGNQKNKLFDLLLIEAYSKGERRPTLLYELSKDVKYAFERF